MNYKRGDRVRTCGETFTGELMHCPAVVIDTPMNAVCLIHVMDKQGLVYLQGCGAEELEPWDEKSMGAFPRG